MLEDSKDDPLFGSLNRSLERFWVISARSVGTIPGKVVNSEKKDDGN